MVPMRLIKRWQKRLRALVHTKDVDRELDEELAFHLEMETAKGLRAGLTPREANRQARLAWFPDLSLDFKLGGRMLVKYPGLTPVGGLAMAFAIWAGSVTFEMVTLILNPSLPLPGGDRIVQIRSWDAEASGAEPRVLHDFITWRESLQSVTDLGAFRDIAVNLVAEAGDARPVQVAEITAPGFLIASEPPLLGRALIAEDERAGAPLVIVLGYNVWQTRFASAPDVVGRSMYAWWFCVSVGSRAAPPVFRSHTGRVPPRLRRTHAALARRRAGRSAAVGIDRCADSWSSPYSSRNSM